MGLSFQKIQRSHPTFIKQTNILPLFDLLECFKIKLLCTSYITKTFPSSHDNTWTLNRSRTPTQQDQPVLRNEDDFYIPYIPEQIKHL